MSSALASDRPWSSLSHQTQGVLGRFAGHVILINYFLVIVYWNRPASKTFLARGLTASVPGLNFLRARQKYLPPPWKKRNSLKMYNEQFDLVVVVLHCVYSI